MESSAAATRPITGETRVVGVIGNPIRHSLSPVIHNAAFAAMGIDWVSLAFPVADDGGPAAMAAMRALDIRGLSVTMPHKETVVAAIDGLAPSASALGVTNCIVASDASLTGHTELIGHNTDGDGFVRSLRHKLDFDPAGQAVAVLGAGGAARSIVDALGRVGASDIAIVNRTESKAADVAAFASQARVGASADIAGAALVINTTSVGMTGDHAQESAMPCDPALLSPRQAVVEIIYNPDETSWLRAARACGARGLNGVAMLVHQAAISLELWTGMEPDLDAMFAATEIELAARAAAHR